MAGGHMASVWGELQRRNVVRVAIAYAVVAWLVLQIADTVLDNISAPAWVFQTILLLLIIGFPVALVFAWAFELTPDGVKREKHVVRSESVTQTTGRRIDFVIIGVLAIAVVVFAVDRFGGARSDAPAEDLTQQITATEIQQSIAVMPFVNMSSDPEQEYFSDGLAEEILNLLAKMQSLKVIARTSSFAFKGKTEDMRLIGQQLGVKTLLEGSVRKSGERVRITAQLIDASDGSHIWSETYDRTMTDIFAVQDDVATAIVGALQIHVGTIPSRGRPTDNSEAYSLFLKARVLRSNGQKAALPEALLAEAIILDPTFAEAIELLSYYHWNFSRQQLAKETAGRALSLKPDLVLARAIFDSADSGSVLGGIRAFEEATRQEPGYAPLLQPFSWNLIQAGYLREGLEWAERLVEIDPLSSFAQGWLSVALHTNGRHEDALESAERAQSVGDSNGIGSAWPAFDYLADNQDGKAINVVETCLQQVDGYDSSWVRPLIENGRNSPPGQAYLDEHLPDIEASAPSTCSGFMDYLHVLYLVFGYTDRYYELIVDAGPDAARWSDSDLLWFDGIEYRRKTGFTQHSKFLELAETMGFIDVWENRGAPDFCEEAGGVWVCE
jgi:TolB-like protein/tetratricopeptide (TPR) repeat protein